MTVRAVAAVDLGATSGRVMIGRIGDGRLDLELVSRFPNGPVERRFSVLYGYQWEGANRDSELWKLRGSGWTSKEENVQALVARYPEGSAQECRVNPGDPEIAVLELESKAPGYSLWFPGIFVVGGIGMIVGAWRR